MKQSLWAILQSLRVLRKGYIPPNFTQVEFYISQNFPKFNSMQGNSIQFFLSCMQEKLQNYASRCTIKRLWNYNVYVFFSVLMQNMFQ